MTPLFALLLAACGSIEPSTVDNPTPPSEPVVRADPSVINPVAPPPAAPAMGPIAPGSLAGKSKAELRVLRNEVFARHGRPFASDDLKAHFAAKPWYRENAAYSDDMLNEVDKGNVALIASMETERDPSGSYQFSGEPMMMFPEEGTVIIGDSADVYMGAAPTRHYKELGDWILVWDGPTPYNPSSATDVSLHRLDYETLTVAQTIENPTL